MRENKIKILDINKCIFSDKITLMSPYTTSEDIYVYIIRVQSIQLKTNWQLVD